VVIFIRAEEPKPKFPLKMRTRHFLEITLVIVCLASFAAAQNTWLQKSDLSPNNRHAGVSFVLNGAAYVGLGINQSGYLGDLWQYDPVSDTWAQKANFPVSSGRHSAFAFTINDKAYVGGGYYSSSNQQDMYEYDPATNSWAQKANFSGGPRRGAVAFSIGNKGYVGTGRTDVNVFKDLYEYDALTNAWTQKADLPGVARTWSGAFNTATKGYVTCGDLDGNGSSWVNDTWEYDPGTNTWTAKASFSGSSRSGMTGFCINNLCFIAAGQAPAAKTNDLWEYNTAADTWSQRLSIPGPERTGAIGFTLNNKGYFGCGWAQNGTYLKDFYEYTPGNPVSISGSILTETGTPVAGVTVTLSGDDSQSHITDTSGRYNFTVVQGGSYNVIPSKNNDVVENNGITSIDVLLTRRHVLGTPLSTSYKIIAADTDASGSVSALDILLMRSMILQNITTFPNGRLWSFIPSSHVFADPLSPFPFPSSKTYTNLQLSVTNQDFIGIKLGDVNNSWDPNTP